MARSILLVVCVLLVVGPLAGCSGLVGGPGGTPSPSGSERTDVAPTSPSGSETGTRAERVTPTTTPSATPTPTSTAPPTPDSTPTSTPSPDTVRLPLGSSDAPDGPDLGGVPDRYREHVEAAGSYRLSASFVVDPADDRTDRIDARALRGDEVAIDRVRRADTFRAYDDDLVTATETTASYRPESGPHLYYRNGSLRPGPEVGTIRGASYREAVGYPPWNGSDLAVRLAAAVRLTPDASVRIDGDRATRHRVTGLNRSAYDALGLRARDDLLARVAGGEGRAEYPDRVTGTVTLDAADRIRRVNLTLERSRRNESARTVRRRIAVDARLRPVDAVDRPTWVERTGSVRFERLPEADGVAFAVEHLRGPPLRRPTGSLRTGNATSRTEFLLLARGTLAAGETLYVWVAPRDDENGMEAYTAVGDRPDGPFVPLRVRSLELMGTARHDGSVWETRHLLGNDTTDGG